MTLLPLHLTGCYSKQVGESFFEPDVEMQAVRLAAYDILLQLEKEGKIEPEEIRYIARKWDIDHLM